jgi:hypothetical protein
MASSDVIAAVSVVIAAAALIPQVVQWIRKEIKAPLLEILSARTVALGVTPSGPLVQIVLAVSSQNRDVIVTRMDAVVRHQTHEERLLEWTSATEPLMNISIPGVPQIAYDKRQAVLAIKATNETLTEKVIVFTDMHFFETSQDKINLAREHFNYLAGHAKEPATEIRNSKEFKQAERFLTDRIFWREGTYDLELEVSGRKLKTSHKEVFRFTLTARDIELLQGNLALLKEDLHNQVAKGERPHLQWIYVHPAIHPVRNDLIGSPHGELHS